MIYLWNTYAHISSLRKYNERPLIFCMQKRYHWTIFIGVYDFQEVHIILEFHCQLPLYFVVYKLNS